MTLSKTELKEKYNFPSPIHLVAPYQPGSWHGRHGAMGAERPCTNCSSVLRASEPFLIYIAWIVQDLRTVVEISLAGLSVSYTSYLRIVC